MADYAAVRIDDIEGIVGGAFKRARGALAGDVALQAAHEHGGLARVLGAGEVGRRGRLVGDRDPGGLELAPARVGAAAPVLERPEAGDADRDVRLTVAPGAPERVRDHD